MLFDNIYFKLILIYEIINNTKIDSKFIINKIINNMKILIINIVITLIFIFTIKNAITTKIITTLIKSIVNYFFIIDLLFN